VRKAGGWDKNLLAALERFISQAERKNVRLIWTISPNLEYDNGQDKDSMEKIRSIADRHEIKIFDFTNSPGFLGHDELFVDAGHLNDAGARIFSKMVADKIKGAFPDLNSR
jgi:lysophospholipase L1-like esterase